VKPLDIIELNSKLDRIIDLLEKLVLGSDKE
jgi:hypothetical protein